MSVEYIHIKPNVAMMPTLSSLEAPLVITTTSVPPVAEKIGTLTTLGFQSCSDDIAWFSSSLIRNVIDAHAPVKSKIITKQSVPCMNSKLRKVQYARNMARNKFQRFGKAYWEENRRHRNNVAKIRKSSMRIYFEKNCKKHDKQFWRTISPSCLTRSLEMGVI